MKYIRIVALTATAVSIVGGAAPTFAQDKPRQTLADPCHLVADVGRPDFYFYGMQASVDPVWATSGDNQLLVTRRSDRNGIAQWRLLNVRVKVRNQGNRDYDPPPGLLPLVRLEQRHSEVY